MLVVYKVWWGVCLVCIDLDVLKYKGIIYFLVDMIILGIEI